MKNSSTTKTNMTLYRMGVRPLQQATVLRLASTQKVTKTRKTSLEFIPLDSGRSFVCTPSTAPIDQMDAFLFQGFLVET